jgi:diacylglycerol kinase (ATP)
MNTLLRPLEAGRIARHARSRPIEIVVTPGSGSGRAMSTALELRDALSGRGLLSSLVVFPDLDSLHRWATADGDQFSTLICVGGDATQSATARAAIRRSVPFLPISSGFGNLFAQTFGGPSSVEGALDLLAKGLIVYSDVGTRNDEVFLCEQSYGLIFDVQEAVEAAASRPRVRLQRWLAYYRAALGCLRAARVPRLRVVVDGEVVATDAALVVVANVEAYGRWLPLTPDASPVDGLFDVFVMHAATQRHVFAKLLRRHLRLPGRLAGTQVVRGERISVAGPDSTHDELEILRQRLPVVISPATLAKLERGLARRRSDDLLAPARIA